MEDVLVDGLNWLTRRLLRGKRRSKARTGEAWVLGREAGGTEPAHLQAEVALSGAELDRHLYVLGASGSGKSRLLELLIRQQIDQRAGFCLVDPHGDLTSNVLAYLHGERKGAGEAPFDPARIYLVEPFREDGLIGLNPLDPNGGPLHPHIGELVAIFRRFWASSWGPRMEELLRTTLLTLALAELTLVEAIPLLTEVPFRASVLRRVEDEAVRGYWRHRYDPLSDAARSTVSEPVLNKLGALLADPRLRAMLGQRERSLHLRRLMDGGAWLLVNCARGQLRDASYLLGSLFVAQLQSTALSRSDVPEAERRPFTVFVDEFQHFRGEDFENILCEARKFRLRLVIAHQHLGQLEAGLQNAVFGNVATHVFFALSPQDAAVAAKRSEEGTALAPQLVHLPVGHALVCRRGSPPVPTRIRHVDDPEGERQALDRFASRLRRRHGRPLATIEAELRARAAKLRQPSDPELASEPPPALPAPDTGKNRKPRAPRSPRAPQGASGQDASAPEQPAVETNADAPSEAVGEARGAASGKATAARKRRAIREAADD